MTNAADLHKQEEHLFAVLSGKRFLQMEGLSNEVPFFTDVPERRRPVAVIDPVLIAETGGVPTAFDAFVSYEASGEASTDADGEVVSWEWTVLTQPAGSGIAVEMIDGVDDARRIRFRPDLVGSYAVELVVELVLVVVVIVARQ